MGTYLTLENLKLGNNASNGRNTIESLDGNNPLGLQTQGGNVGIGVSNPGVSFAIGEDDTGINYVTGDKLDFLAANNRIVTMTGSSVGIGTDNPNIQLAIGDNNTGFQQQGSNTLSMYTNNTERMRIDSDGRVSIGTSSPAAILEVNGNSGALPILEVNGTAGSNYVNLKSTSGYPNLNLYKTNGDHWHISGPRNTNDCLKFYYSPSTGGHIERFSLSTRQVEITQPPTSEVYGYSGYGLKFISHYSPFYWEIMIENWSNGNYNNDLIFTHQGGLKGYLDASGSGQLNFTGQHRCLLNNNITKTSVGLIVSTDGTYINTDNTLNPSINESLPICVITNTDNDKKVFGVISDKEDSESSREYSTGIFVSVFDKYNKNEQRMYINSVGEGAIWVSNKNGNLENGDYISSTTVAGYGGKQTTNEEFLTRYTVAKITCDCDFSLNKIVKQKLKVTETTIDGVTTKEIDYDANGDVQYEDDLDEDGNVQMVYKYETRFLQADGTQLTDEADYNTRLANGESVYIACFVGCTYHCG